MAKISASIDRTHYKTTIKSSNNSIIADEPADIGGQDMGFSPEELLASALGSCICITLRMYADRKAWALENVNVDVVFERDVQANTSRFTRYIQISGNLSEEQKNRLMAIADKCYIHKTLTSPIEIMTSTT